MQLPLPITIRQVKTDDRQDATSSKGDERFCIGRCASCIAMTGQSGLQFMFAGVFYAAIRWSRVVPGPC